MFEKTEQWQWIDAYLNEQLSEKELQEFKQRLQKEPALLEAVQEYQEMLTLMEQHELLELKKQAKNLLKKVQEQDQQTVEKVNIIELETDEEIEDVVEVEEVVEKIEETPEQLPEQPNTKEAAVIPMPPSIEEEQSTKKVATIGWRWPHYVALVAATLLLFFVPYYLYDSGTFTPAVSPTALAKRHYQTPVQLSISVQRNGTSDALSEKDSLYQAANQLYMEEVYDRALLVLEQLPTSDNVLLDKGICYFQMDNISKAIQHFKEVLNHTDTTVETDDQASWYLALAYLKDNQKENAQQLLKTISKQKDNWKRDEARQMLKQLK